MAVQTEVQDGREMTTKLKMGGGNPETYEVVAGFESTLVRIELERGAIEVQGWDKDGVAGAVTPYEVKDDVPGPNVWHIRAHRVVVSKANHEIAVVNVTLR